MNIFRAIVIGAAGALLMPYLAFANVADAPSPVKDNLEIKTRTVQIASGLGEVTRISLESGNTSITVKTGAGAEFTFVVSDTTKVLFRSVPSRLGFFAAGDVVKILAEKDENGKWKLKELSDLSLRRKLHFSANVDMVAITSDSITIEEENGAQWTFPISKRTMLRYRGGVANVNDFYPGDRIHIVARKVDGEWRTTLVTNLSMRRASVRGEIDSLSGNFFTLESRTYGTLSVTMDDETEFQWASDGSDASRADLTNGMTVLVKGKFHLLRKTITAIREIKLYE